MNDEDRYLFDLQGYLAIPNAIEPGLLARLNAAIDAAIEAEMDPDETRHRFESPLLPRDPAFRELIDGHAAIPMLEEILGPDFRLDHTEADVIRSGEGPIGSVLHGGAVPFRSVEYYTVLGGAIHSGLVAIGFNLKDVNPGDGGFGCVPGSHKAAFAFPDAWKQLADPHPLVRPVPAPAGSAIVLTETLVHGTLLWRGAHERRTLFYRYSPASVSWHAEFHDVPAYAAAYPDLTDRQLEILEPPNARYKGRSTARS